MSVVSSALYGTISGSAVANVVVTGMFTIPLMKRSGFRPSFAAAVEAVASTGGQKLDHRPREIEHLEGFLALVAAGERPRSSESRTGRWPRRL